MKYLMEIFDIDFCVPASITITDCRDSLKRPKTINIETNELNGINRSANKTGIEKLFNGK